MLKKNIWDKNGTFEKTYLRLVKKLGRRPTQDEIAAAGFWRHRITRNTGLGDERSVFTRMKRRHPAEMAKIGYEHTVDCTTKRKEVLKTYATHYKRFGCAPSLMDAGLNSHVVKRHFGSLAELDRLARVTHPSCFFDVAVAGLRTRDKMDALEATIATKKTFLVVAAEEGSKADQGFLAAIKTFLKQRDAALLLLICSNPASRGMGKGIDKSLTELGHVIHSDTELNNNLFLATIKLSPTQIEPLTGLGRIGQRNGSMILASPKQHLRLVATAHTKLPHALMTTGCITVSNYAPDRGSINRDYESQRRAYIATRDHVVGGLVIEVQDNELFHFRQVQADAKGRFIDLGEQFTAAGVERCAPEAAVPGDWHTGSTDPVAREVFLKEMLPRLRPKKLFLHDFFDGHSVNHHERKDLVVRAQRAGAQQLTLKDEVKALGAELKLLASKVPEVLVVKSNHDIFLARYIAAGTHMEDPQNSMFGSQLYQAAVNGEDPLKFGVERLIGALPNVTWLQENDDFKIAGIQMAAHGHRGANGARTPSLTSIEQAYGQSVTEHLHATGILRGAWRGGTMSYLRQGYNLGPSDWIHAVVWVYPNGARQITHIIGRKWRLK
jgi:hypothetical protein